MKAANKQYSKLNSEYELTFKDNGTMELCEDTADVPTMTYNFARLVLRRSTSINIVFPALPICLPLERTLILDQKISTRVSLVLIARRLRASRK